MEYGLHRFIVNHSKKLRQFLSLYKSYYNNYNTQNDSYEKGGKL